MPRWAVILAAMALATRALFTGTATGLPPTEPGTWTPDGTPATIDAGSGHKAFPGVVRLDSGRLLLVYRHGTDHFTGGTIVGRIGTLDGTAVTWGSPFTIYSHETLDVRCEDPVSIIEGQVVVACRHFDGTANQLPFLLVCDDTVSALDDESTWTKHDITFTQGANQNGVNGHLHRIGSTYVIATFAISGSTMESGVLRNASLTDWSSPTYVAIGSDGQMPETSLVPLGGGGVLALIRRQSGSQTYRASSANGGTTWTTPVSAHDGFGYPMARLLGDGALLTVYRDSPDGDTAWRQSSDEGATWGSESILDATGTRNVYASLVQLTPLKALCVYAVETGSDGDLYSQVFTRA